MIRVINARIRVLCPAHILNLPPIRMRVSLQLFEGILEDEDDDEVAEFGMLCWSLCTHLLSLCP